MTGVESRLRAIENELKALKQKQPTSYGQLRTPDEAPTVTYQGTVTSSGGSSREIVARLAVKFTRTDGKTGTPLVNFAYSYTVSPTWAEYLATNGITLTGDDIEDRTDDGAVGYIYSTTGESVTFYVDISRWAAVYGGRPGSINFIARAITTVPGTLSVERLR